MLLLFLNNNNITDNFIACLLRFLIQSVFWGEWKKNKEKKDEMANYCQEHLYFEVLIVFWFSDMIGMPWEILLLSRFLQNWVILNKHL